MRLPGYCAPSRPIVWSAAAWALAVTCASAAACGGLQRGVPSDASADTTSQSTQGAGDAEASDGGAVSTPIAIGPAEADPCGASQQFEYQSLDNFDGLPQLAGQYSPYVSYDGTGILYEATCSSSAPTPCLLGEGGFYAPAKDENNAGGDYIADTLCANCNETLDGGGGFDGGGCGSCSCTSGYQPQYGTNQIPPTVRCGTDQGALHLHAQTTDSTGLSDWGMNFTDDLRQNCAGLTASDGGEKPPCSFDASQWTGISFLEPSASELDLPAALATLGDPETAGVLGGIYPFNNEAHPSCGNPPCSAGTGANITNYCTPTTMPLCLCDPYGQAVGLTNQWTFYAIPFGDLRQKGYGKPVPSLDRTHILSFTLGLGKGNWDVWIDEIAFYRPKSH